MNKLTKADIRWAKRLGDKLGGVPAKKILNMRWSEFEALAHSKGLRVDFLFKDVSKRHTHRDSKGRFKKVPKK